MSHNYPSTHHLPKACHFKIVNDHIDASQQGHIRLLAIRQTLHRRFEGRSNGYFCFPKTHITTDEPVHGDGLFHVSFDSFCGSALIWCVFVLE